ncbi:hypothetical protein C824_002547 [Schaedlerella arabinosiphila]|nr:hypothetical protein C824_002547 [Schaedlerella arabinosiphila]
MKNTKSQDGTLTRKELKELTQNAIREYVDTRNRNNEPINSKNEIIEYVQANDEAARQLSPKTLYRYLDEMHCEEIAAGKFDFIIEDNQLSLKSVITYKKYNYIACFYIDFPEYTKLLASLINEHYRGKEDIFHCIALDDTLLCLYYFNKKKNTNSLTRKEIKDNVIKIAKKYTIYAK